MNTARLASLLQSPAATRALGAAIGVSLVALRIASVVFATTSTAPGSLQFAGSAIASLFC